MAEEVEVTPDALALDLGTLSLGWCASYGGAWQSGEERFKGDLDERLGQFMLWLRPRMPEKTLVIEVPHVRWVKAAIPLLSQAGVARAMAAMMEVAVVLLSPAETKRCVTGSGAASKEDMIAWATLERGYAVGEHEADSCAAMRCWELRDYKVKPVKKKRRKK